MQQSLQRRIMQENLSLQTVMSHLIKLSNLIQNSCVELNAAIRHLMELNAAD